MHFDVQFSSAILKVKLSNGKTPISPLPRFPAFFRVYSSRSVIDLNLLIGSMNCYAPVETNSGRRHTGFSKLEPMRHDPCPRILICARKVNTREKTKGIGLGGYVIRFGLDIAAQQGTMSWHCFPNHKSSSRHLFPPHET
jgi:hypothetical protein